MNRPDGQAVTGETLTIQVYREPTYIIITALGEIDIATVGRLRERLFDPASSGRPLVVDLNYVNLVDAAGLGALIGASRGPPRMGPPCMWFALDGRPSGCSSRLD